jgi:hypothetical protein
VGGQIVGGVLTGFCLPFSSARESFRNGRYNKEGGNACELLAEMMIAAGGGSKRSLGRQALEGCVVTACPVRNIRTCLLRHANRHTCSRYDVNGVCVMAEGVLLLVPLLPSSVLEEPPRHDSRLLAQRPQFLQFESA